MQRWTRRSACALVALAMGGVAAQAQDPAPRRGGEPDERARRAAKAVERYRAYLARKPFHDWAFDKLIEAAVANNALEALVEDYRTASAQDPGDLPARVVLARLYARVDRRDEALKLLAEAEVEPKQRASWLALRGALHLRLREPKPALELLRQAAAATRDRRLLGTIQRRRGEAALAAGAKQEAVAAFRALAELSPRSLSARLESARLMADNGLTEEALAELGRAKDLAGDEAAQRCRVLAEIGQLHERRAELRAALAAYREAIELTGRGNWLARDLRARVLAIHRRAGKLNELIAQARADAEARPADLGRREFLAEVLEAAEQPSAARELLEAACRDFPQDLALSRRLLALLERLDATEARIAEYQRVLVHHPQELELYLELGQAFAKSGRLAAARRQWQESLRERLQDPALCLRLAELYARFRQVDDAVELYQRALQLRPGDVAATGDLARLLARHERAAEIGPLLEQAAQAVAGQAGGLREVSALFAAHGQPERALALLERAIAARGQPSGALLRRKASLLLQLQRVEPALACLERSIEFALDPGARADAVEALLRAATQHEQLEALLARSQRAVADQADRLAPYLLVARASLRARAPGRAQQALEALLAVRPAQPDAHRELARLYERQGQLGQALAHQRALLQGRGGPPRRVLLEIARLHLQRYEHEEALAVYRKVLAASPSNPAAFQEVAQAYERIGRFDEARRCLRQAVRLQPQDGKLRLKLAQVLERLGERAKASEEILAATRSEDRRVRERARKAYYRALSSQGAVEQRIEALRQRCLDNPYDVSAPLTLIDLYVRELEYEPALELVDTLLGYQPRQPELLEQRARLCLLLERHEEAIAAYETLWRLPKADRQRLSLAIADAALRRGDLARAEQSLSTVRDAARVARLYRERDLPDRAQEVLRAGLARDPRDARLHRRLARLAGELGEHAAALESLERLVALKGPHWERLQQLGTLYHHLERQPELERTGDLLFAQLRRDPPEERDEEQEDEDDDDPWRRRQQQSWQRRYRQRLSQLQRFFARTGAPERFVTLGAAEWRLQPHNDLLLNRLVSAARGPETSRVALELLDEAALRAASGQHPPTQTARAWLASLRRTRLSVYRREAKLRQERVAALQARLNELSLLEGIELLSLLDVAQAHPEQQAALAALRARFPDSPRLLLADALRLERADQPREALPLVQRALRALEAQAEARAAEEARRAELAFKTQRADLRQSFPLRLRGRVGGEVLRRLFELGWSPGASSAWALGREPDPRGVRLLLAKLAERAEQPAQVAAALAGLVPARSDDLQGWSRLAIACFEREEHARAAEVCQRLRALERELSADPLLGHNPRWQRHLDAPMQRWGRHLAQEGQPVRAYELLRTYGDAPAGRLVLSEQEALPAAERFYAEQVAAARAALAEAAAGAAGRLRDAGIKLAEVRQFAKDWEGARAAYEELLNQLPDAWELYGALASLHLRADRIDEAVAVYRRAVERKRAQRQRPPRQPEPPGRELTPLPPDGLESGQQHWALNNLGYVGGSDPLSPAPEYGAILKIYLSRRRLAQAASALRQIAREDARTFRWLGYSLSALVRDFKLGPAGLPVLRLLWTANPKNAYLGLDVARSLVAGKDLRGARQILRRVRSQASASAWVREETDQLLERISRQLERDARPSRSELEAAARAQPRQAKPRVRLVRRLLQERDFRAALSAAEELRRLAPHLDEARELYRRALTITGQDEGLAAELERAAKRAKGQARLSEWLRVANLLAPPPGQELGEPVRRALAEAEKAAGSPPNYSVANWHAERGDLLRAQELLERALDKAPTGNWARARIERNLLSYAIRAGRGAKVWELVDRQLEQAGTRAKRYDTYLQLLSSLDEAALLPAQRQGLLAAAEARAPGLRRLYQALVHLEARDLPAAERALTEGLEEDLDAARWALPLYLHLALARRDWSAALQRADALQRSGVLGGDSVWTPFGSLSERDLLHALRGELLLRLEREQEGLAALEEVLDPQQPPSRLTYARLLARLERWPAAIEALEAYLSEGGKPTPELLGWQAEWEERAGRRGRALATLERARTLALGDERAWRDPLAQVQTALLSLHRRAGSLPAYRRQLEERIAADPDDAKAAMTLTRVLAELGDEGALRAHLEALAQAPAKAPGIHELLADAHQRAGRLREAAEALGQVQTGQQWQDRQRHQRRARLLLHLGERRAALAALAEGYQDPEAEEALAARQGLLLRARAWEPLLELLDLRERLAQPGSSAQALTRATALEALGRPAEALVQVWRRLCAPEGWDAQQSERARLLRLEAQAGPAAGVAALASGSAADRAFRPALLARLRGEADALTRARALRAAHPAHLPARWNLLQALVAAGDPQAALAELEPLLERYQREAAAGTCDASPLSELVTLAGRLHLARGEPERALAAWRRPPGGKLRSVQAYSYAIYNDFERSSVYAEAAAHHLFAQAADEVLRASSHERQRDAARLLLRAGRDERALSHAWRGVDDPIGGLLDGSQRASEALLEVAHELGRLDEVLAELARRDEVDPSRGSLRGLLIEARLRFGQDERALTLLRAARAEGDEDPAALGREAGCLERLGRPAEALALRRRQLRLREGSEIRFRAGDPYALVVQRGRGGPQLTFAWAGSGASGGGSTYYSSRSRGPGGVEGLRQLERSLLGGIAALDTDAAADAPPSELRREQLERERRWLASSLDPFADRLALAERYAELGQLSDARRVAPAPPASLERAPEREQARALWEARARWSRAAALEPSHRAAVAGWLAVQAEALRRDPFARELRAARCRFLLRELRPLAQEAPPRAWRDQAEADLRWLQAALPRDGGGWTLAGWLALRSGEGQAARAAFRAAAERYAAAGAGQPELWVLGQALALHLDQDASARRWLRRAWQAFAAGDPWRAEAELALRASEPPRGEAR